MRKLLRFKCLILVVHHSGLSDADRPRGHSSFACALDALFHFERKVGTKSLLMTVQKLKDEEDDGKAFDLRMVTIVIGKDRDGDEISTLIVESIEPVGAQSRKAPLPKKLTKGAKIALAALHEAIGDCGAVPPASNHIPQGVKAVTVSRWRDYAYRQGVTSSNEPRARQVAFQRAHETLVAAKQVAVWEPYAWLV